PERVAARVVVDSPEASESGEDVLESLLSDQPSSPDRAMVEPTVESSPSDVDQSMIDRLTGDGETEESGDRT
ncbi:MAG: hypothetical protein QF723_09025, partial [Phycisphaerales bacterium]|nr:hypothetical protein [Phycisphaerales bacterium]